MVNASANNILPIKAIADAKEVFAATDKETLVIFDVDCVLTMPTNPLLQLPTFNKYKDSYAELRLDLTKDERHILNHLIITHGSSQLVEVAFLEIIEQLQQRNIKSIAMTAGKTGNVGQNLCFPDWRFAELKRLGIDFSSVFPDKVYFTELVSFNGDGPGMDRGIVYSTGNRNTKGELLKHVFGVLKWQPRRILAIDDRLKNLHSFFDTTNSMLPKIDFLGLHYQGADFVPTVDVAEEAFVNLISSLVRIIHD